MHYMYYGIERIERSEYVMYGILILKMLKVRIAQIFYARSINVSEPVATSILSDQNFILILI